MLKNESDPPIELCSEYDLLSYNRFVRGNIEQIVCRRIHRPLYEYPYLLGEEFDVC
jgi:hypothetical protein